MTCAPFLNMLNLSSLISLPDSQMTNMIFQIPLPIILLLVAFFTNIPTIASTCSDLMSTSLSSTGFALFAHAIHAQNLTSTIRLTFLAPPDTALVNRFLDSQTLNGHVITVGALPYQSLLTLPPNTTLPTLRHNTSLIVDTDGQSVSLGDSLVNVPNLYIDESCIVHGVDGPLVPIPSSVDDSPKPSTYASPSPSASRRRLASQFISFVRFIRRAHGPVLGDRTSELDRP